jgi:mRNA-degrading endonuclease RelE of RelBE toxin-antitoxin system
MLYSLVASPLGSRSLKKLPVGVRNFLIEELDVLKNNPHAGESLRGKLSKFHSFHTRLAGTDYRAIYEINKNIREIVIHYVGTRENIYKEVERKLR